MIRSIAGAVGAKIRKKLVNRKFAQNITTNKIGDSTVLGQKNYDNYYSRIRDMANDNKQEEAIKYAIEEGNKVVNDKSSARKAKRNTWFNK